MEKTVRPRFALFFYCSAMVTTLLFLGGCQSITPAYVDAACLAGECIHPLDRLNTDQLESTKLARVNFVEQFDQKGCGAAVLSSVLQYWDIDASYEEIVSNHPSNSVQGYSVGELKTLALEYGLLAFSLSMTETFLQDSLINGRPVIVAVKPPIVELTDYLPDLLYLKQYLTYSHFLVVIGYDEVGYWFVDPARGYLYLPAEKFIDMWGKQNFVGLLVSSKSVL